MGLRVQANNLILKTLINWSTSSLPVFQSSNSQWSVSRPWVIFITSNVVGHLDPPFLKMRLRRDTSSFNLLLPQHLLLKLFIPLNLLLLHLFQLNLLTPLFHIILLKILLLQLTLLYLLDLHLLKPLNPSLMRLSSLHRIPDILFSPLIDLQ